MTIARNYFRFEVQTSDGILHKLQDAFNLMELPIWGGATFEELIPVPPPKPSQYLADGVTVNPLFATQYKAWLATVELYIQDYADLLKQDFGNVKLVLMYSPNKVNWYTETDLVAYGKMYEAFPRIVILWPDLHMQMRKLLRIQ